MVEETSIESLYDCYCNFDNLTPANESPKLTDYFQPSLPAIENLDDYITVISPPGKRHRTRYTTQQILILEQKFLKKPYISIKEKQEIARILNLTERNVKVWFQNRRQKQIQKEKKLLLAKEKQSPLPVLDPYECEEFFKNNCAMCAVGVNSTNNKYD